MAGADGDGARTGHAVNAWCLARHSVAGPHVPAGRVPRCAVCGRRMESCWSSHRPACRCRHGRSTPSPLIPDRPRKAYLREDQALGHLLALAIRLGTVASAAPPAVPDIVARLRTDRITLTYDPAAKTLTADTHEPRGSPSADRHPPSATRAGRRGRNNQRPLLAKGRERAPISPARKLSRLYRRCVRGGT